MNSGIRTGKAAVLKAQARNLKKVWRRGRVRSRELVEQLLQQLSLGSGGPSSRPGPTCYCMQSLQYSAVSGDHKQINEVARPPAVADDDDDGPFSRMRPNTSANYLMSMASCCFNVHYLSYQPLIDESSVQCRSLVSQSVSCSGHNFPASPACHDSNATVLLKVSIVGDSDTGKTSFMAKYVCPEGELVPDFVETVGVATEEKVVHVKSGTHIAFNIWDLGGHWQCGSMLPLVCRDAAAILIMFDLTRRSTLNSVMDWFVQARECNKAALTVMVGTKYDHFVELPQNIQHAVIQQARVCARAMGAPLFFSSVTHNINVHKVFKVIVAKLFDLPCPIPTNLNFGEPLVDY